MSYYISIVRNKREVEIMEKQIEKLVQDIKADFVKWATKGGKEELSGYFKTKVDSFEDKITVKYGSKYIKIISDGSVWGFVVNTDKHPKFKKGDILKAAGYNQPAMNKARGNVIDGGYSISWTGPHYLI